MRVGSGVGVGVVRQGVAVVAVELEISDPGFVVPGLGTLALVEAVFDFGEGLRSMAKARKCDQHGG